MTLFALLLVMRSVYVGRIVSKVRDGSKARR